MPEFLTHKGYEKLKEELLFLRTAKRAEVADRIRVAKEDGDVTENAGYDAAKEEQAFVEGRILTVEQILKQAQIIENSGCTDSVSLGSTVTVREADCEPESFQIVGAAEANPSMGRISNESPLGRAILGRRVGDAVEVSAPGGLSMFEILDIR
jgi:transcription elongation factor GreA